MGYTSNNPKDLKDVILRRLGAPIINVEVTEEQVFDCIQRALELYGEYHYEGLNKSYMAIKLTEQQASQGLVMLPDDNVIFAVTRIIRSNAGCLANFGGTPYTWFSDFINGLSANGQCNIFGPYGSGSLSIYTSVMSYLNLLKDVLDPIQDYWYNGVNGQLKLNGNLKAGDTIIIEVFVKSFMQLDQTTNTAGNRQFRAGGDCANNTSVSDLDIYNNPYREMTNTFMAGCNQNQYMDQNVYNVRWVKDYSTALVKELNGYILAKHQGMQLPGGVTINGERIIEEARTEIDKLREELYMLEEPLPIIMG